MVDKTHLSTILPTQEQKNILHRYFGSYISASVSRYASSNVSNQHVYAIRLNNLFLFECPLFVQNITDYQIEDFYTEDVFLNLFHQQNNKDAIKNFLNGLSADIHIQYNNIQHYYYFFSYENIYYLISYITSNLDDISLYFILPKGETLDVTKNKEYSLKNFLAAFQQAINL